ncbi:MAG: CsgG/HfaB family protein, partial [Rhodospirillales bacterium]|nr:CsgG/HfaB family protein [Rhodospirillales bacterium]
MNHQTVNHRMAYRSGKVAALSILLALVLSAFAWAEPQQADNAETKDLTVAVLDFEARLPGNDQLGEQIGDTLTTLLAGEEGLRLVERPKLRNLLDEQGLSLTGMVSANDAVTVGNLVGARIIVSGRVFPIGSKIYITTKIIGTETSLVDGVLIKGNEETDTGELVSELADKLTKKLREVGPKLVAPDQQKKDPLPALIAALKGRSKPTAVVHITERHLNQAERNRDAIDPAVQSEVAKMLRAAGFTLFEVDAKTIDAWEKAPGTVDWPKRLEKVDVIVVGEAISEYSARMGNLVSCAGRAEVKLLDRRTGKVLLTDRTTQRAVELSENIAAKNALEKAGRELGIKLLTHFDEHLPGAVQQ